MFSRVASSGEASVFEISAAINATLLVCVWICSSMVVSSCRYAVQAIYRC